MLNIYQKRIVILPIEEETLRRSRHNLILKKFRMAAFQENELFKALLSILIMFYYLYRILITVLLYHLLFLLAPQGALYAKLRH